MTESARGSAPRRLLFALLAGASVIPLRARAQDVELFGYMHGTRPPDGYYEQMRRDPNSFRFRVEGPDRMEQVRFGMRTGPGGIGFRTTVPGGPAGAVGILAPSGAPARTLGPRDPVAGVFEFPLVLGLYSDGLQTPPFSREAVRAQFLDGPNPDGRTVPEFYGEMSRGMAQLQGTAFPWVQSGLTRAQVTLGSSGLSGSQTGGVGAFIEAIVTALDQSGVDWSPFDGDGDGYVDVLTVIHPTAGAECNGATDHIWSHAWNLASATNGRLAGAPGQRSGIRTSTPAASGGFIYVNDYTIQPLLACDGQAISEIGTFAHEMGHAFGLPDLYRTYASPFYAGAGSWDLMATGGWGCRDSSPEQPCHMGAWSKAMLGWVTVEEVPPETDEIVTLEPVETSGRVLKLPARDGSNEYVLIENREPIGSDGLLHEPGLLIWHINDDVLAANWASNMVNSDPNRMGVWLRQADGRGDLLNPVGGRGDPGDSFPGCIKPSWFDYGDPSVPCTHNMEFRAGKAPEAVSREGKGLGTTVLDIQLLGAEPHDAQFRVNTHISTVQVAAEREGTPTSVSGFVLDGAMHSSTPFQFLSAPFETHELTAAGGIPTTPGKRISFLEWADGGPRTRSLTTGFSDETYLARYQNEEIRLRVNTNEPVEGVAPATFTADPGAQEPEGDDFWFPQGTMVSVLATPRKGFAFRDWVGVDSPNGNPATLTLDSPSEIQANFDLTYGLAAIPPALQIEAAAPQQIALEVLDGNDPVTWSVETGALPPGLTLGSTTGVITGAATDTGQFQAGVLARDAIGLEARGELALEVGPPNVGVQELISGFVGSEQQLTALQIQYFDRAGNANGSYDVGDFRAYLQANPDPPEVGAPAAASPPRTTVRIGAFEGAPADLSGEGEEGSGR